MSLKIDFVKKRGADRANLILPLMAGARPDAHGMGQDFSDFIARAMALNPKFKAGHGDILDFVLPESVGGERVILLGLGPQKDMDALKAADAGGKLCAHMAGAGLKAAALLCPETCTGPDLKHEDLIVSIAAGFQLRSYKFERYKSKRGSKNAEPDFETLDIVCARPAHTKALFKIADCIAQGVFLARDLVNMPPNDLYPDAYAKIIKKELKPLGVEIEVLDEKQMLKLGMGAILAVGQGSERPPRMVVMRWNGSGSGTGKSAKNGPISFVGKGVTFDTGGISIKPGAGMDEMKMDMGGSAAVIGLFKTLALRKAKVHAVGVVGLAENMPSDRAYRPGDIIKSYAGKTIEVLNTDAEGRLVLADCLTYVQKTSKPSFIIDLATLTGAMMVALGHEYCGTFANDDVLWTRMEEASTRTGEKLWRMPLDEVWRDQMKSEVADLQNLGKSGRYAGACTAAGFLEHFIDNGTPWAHMDIAGTAWIKADRPTVPKFGSGFGVQVLNALVSAYYEG